MATIEELTAVISAQAGETAALNAVVFALCLHLEPASPLALAIDRALEQAYSQKLQRLTNQAYFDGFEKTMELLKEALREPPAG